MLVWLSKYLSFVNLSLIAFAGVALGLLAAVGTGMLLAPPAVPGSPGSGPPPAPQRALSLNDYGVIVERNIFNHAARTAAPSLDQGEGSRPAPAAGDLVLLGTVVAEADSLALIRQPGGNEIYRLGDKLPDGAGIEAIERNRIVLRDADGTQRELAIEALSPGSPPAPEDAASGGIREIGRNRWLVSRDEVEKARSNLNSLLKSARMEPKIVNGHTEGFVVRMIRPKSLLDRLGVQRNDLVREVNGVTLDSPEKALQIFQQLREAKRIVIGLERSDQLLNLEYTIE